MKIDLVELRRVAMPLVVPFRTSFGTESARDVLLVRVEGPDTAGWGECVAMTEPLYSSEYVEASHRVMRDHLLPRLAASDHDVAPEAVAGMLRAVKGHRMAKAAVEMAVLDGELTAEGVSFADYFGAVEKSVPSGVSVGIPGSIEELLETVGGYLDEGYVRIKLKIEPGWDIEPVAAVRRTFGDELALQVDANACYTLEDAGHLRQLDAYGLLLIEQPLAEEDIAGHAALAAQLSTPICLDESITSLAAAVDAMDRGACSVVNIKAGRLGGYLEAKAVHDACLARGIPVWCGGMLETGIGRAANLALAALPGFSITGDISASDRYWSEDLTEPFVLEDGRIRVPEGPGLGVRVDTEVIDRHTTRLERIRLGR